MKCLVWNMDYWKRTEDNRAKAWEYIQSVDPDVCLLNECSTHTSQEYSVHSVYRRGWGTGVFSKHQLTEITSVTKGTRLIPLIKSHPESLVSTKFELNSKNITAISWVHYKLKKPKESIRQCLFGLHLFNDNIKQVAIVESEKTAIIMTIELPQYTWMATGSLGGFKDEYLKPLKSKEIIAFPDKGGYDKWKTTANNLNSKEFNIRVSKLLEIDEYEMGWDLVDVFNYEKKK